MITWVFTGSILSALLAGGGSYIISRKIFRANIKVEIEQAKAKAKVEAQKKKDKSTRKKANVEKKVKEVKKKEENSSNLDNYLSFIRLILTSLII